MKNHFRQPPKSSFASPGSETTALRDVHVIDSARTSPGVRRLHSESIFSSFCFDRFHKDPVVRQTH